MLYFLTEHVFAVHLINIVYTMLWSINIVYIKEAKHDSTERSLGMYLIFFPCEYFGKNRLIYWDIGLVHLYCNNITAI